VRVRASAATALIAILTALTAPGCGKSKEEELFDRRKQVCDALLKEGLTIREATERFSIRPLLGYCPPAGQKLVKLPNDTCNYDDTLPVCTDRWEWLAQDNDLCSPFGCVYGCEARFISAPGQDTINDAKVCGTQFYKGQPLQ
jgi:hypothetical protein